MPSTIVRVIRLVQQTSFINRFSSYTADGPRIIFTVGDSSPVRILEVATVFTFSFNFRPAKGRLLVFQSIFTFDFEIPD